jgi:hypothetical protein
MGLLPQRLREIPQGDYIIDLKHIRNWIAQGASNY